MRKFSMSPAVEGEFEDICQSLRISKSNFIELALIEYMSQKDKFIICPYCDTYLAVKSLIDAVKLVKRFYCKCGCKLWINSETGLVVRVDKTDTLYKARRRWQSGH